MVPQVEAQFTIGNLAITNDNTKFVYLLSALPADIAEFMEFAVENSTEGDKYSSLEAVLIKQFGLTKEQKASLIHDSGPKHDTHYAADAYAPIFT